MVSDPESTRVASSFISFIEYSCRLNVDRSTSLHSWTRTKQPVAKRLCKYYTYKNIVIFNRFDPILSIK